MEYRGCPALAPEGFFNCTWKDGQLKAEYRKPFDVLALAVAQDQQQTGEMIGKTAGFENWLPKKTSFQRSLIRVTY